MWNETNVCHVTKGEKIGNWYSDNISTDTRSIKRGDLFIALKGKNFDGHDFVHEAFVKGAVAAIVSKKGMEYSPLVIVNDTLQALHNMASYYIKHLDATIIAVTGSIGKTTTKDMLYTVLSQYGVSHVNSGNLNNNIGLPLTILSSPVNCKYLVLEMGMNHKGEIEELSRISSPDIAVITNIEYAHIENFPSIYAIAQAKLEVLCGMKSNGVLILNHDNEYYNYLSSYADKIINRKIISFGRHKDATVRLLNLTKIYNELSLDLILNNDKVVNFNLPTRREHLIYSAMAVVAVMQSLKLDLPKNAFDTFKMVQGRGKIYNIRYYGKQICLIDDSYNASPASMKVAIEDLGGYFNNRRVIFLGDMVQLGNQSIKFHTELLDHIIDQKISRVYTVGKMMAELYKLLPADVKGMHFYNAHQSSGKFNDIVEDHDVILVKGSRLMNMDIIVKECLSHSVFCDHITS